MRDYIWVNRFWNRIRYTDTCWLWLGGRSGGGGGQRGQYGDVMRHGQRLLAHRVAWSLEYGPIPDGKMILHRCDVKLCVRPTHLYAGTALDNSRDAVERGQQPRGERHGSRTKPDRWFHGPRGETHPSAKLTQGQVESIREALNRGESQKQLAQSYGVTASNICHINRGRSWRPSTSSQ